MLSGAVYDPEHDGVAMASLGVHEHWNNTTQRQYTRNLATGAGVDLLYVTRDPAREAVSHRLDHPVVVDGAEDAAWAAAPRYTLDHVLSGAIAGAGDLSASFRTLYDADSLYLLAGVTDDALVNDSAAWADDDCVTLLVDGDNSRGAAYDGTNDFALGFCWNDATIATGASSAAAPAGSQFRADAQSVRRGPAGRAGEAARDRRGADGRRAPAVAGFRLERGLRGAP